MANHLALAEKVAKDAAAAVFTLADTADGQHLVMNGNCMTCGNVHAEEA